MEKHTKAYNIYNKLPPQIYKSIVLHNKAGGAPIKPNVGDMADARSRTRLFQANNRAFLDKSVLGYCLRSASRRQTIAVNQSCGDGEDLRDP